MATVTGLTAERMLEIEDESIVQGQVVGDRLILTKHSGATIDAGHVKGNPGTNGTNGTNGAPGPQGPQGPPGMAYGAAIPGEIRMWSGPILPGGSGDGIWRWCDGAVYPEADWPLAAYYIDPVWRTFGGASDPGVGNFRVPDLRGLTPVGMDQMPALYPGGPAGIRANRMTRSVAIVLAGRTGEETHTISIAEIPAHNHEIKVLGSSPGGTAGVHGTTLASTTITGATAIQNNGGGNAHENVQPTVFVPYMVYLGSGV